MQHIVYPIGYTQFKVNYHKDTHICNNSVEIHIYKQFKILRIMKKKISKNGENKIFLKLHA